VNLVSNLGFGRPDASHTAADNSLPAELFETQELWEIKHPPFVVRHTDADKYIFDYIIGGKKIMEKDAPLARIRRRLASAMKWLLTARFRNSFK